MAVSLDRATIAGLFGKKGRGQKFRARFARDSLPKHPPIEDPESAPACFDNDYALDYVNILKDLITQYKVLIL